MIKAIFFDIDGTLVSFKTHTVAPAVVAALHKLRKQGIKIFVASGRHQCTMDHLSAIPFDGYVTLNGGMCIARKRIIYKHRIPATDIATLLDYLSMEERFPCVFVHEHDQSMTYKNATVEKVFAQIAFRDPPIRPVASIWRSAVYQVLGFFNAAQEHRLMRLLPHCAATRWHPLFADIIPAGSNKWIGITKMIMHFGISSKETMAFGDGGNDIEMLQNVQFGVAMGNASDDVQQAAGYVTATVDDDGVVQALRKFKLIR
ncbi:MAG: Cof-type HAD-IIB family hydrolase [Prevotellaceae bacterium]|jgi:Cof subfamily protein (haloacid dehalogenase superfamily)|nr:Cof-type HAD-IIB family hydrolase [Prevotellaceae bacterium]